MSEHPDGLLPRDFPILHVLRSAVSSFLRRDARLVREQLARGGDVTRALAMWATAGGHRPPAPLHPGVGPGCKIAAACVTCGSSTSVAEYGTHLARCKGGQLPAACAPPPPPGRQAAPSPPPPPAFTGCEQLYSLLSASAYVLFRTAFSGLRSHYLVTTVLAYVQVSFDLPKGQALSILITREEQLATTLSPTLAALLDTRVDALGWPLRRVRDLLQLASRPAIVRGRVQACSTTSFTNQELSQCVTAAIQLRWHLQAAYKRAAAGGTTPGFPCPIVTPSAVWSQAVINLTRPGAREMLVLASAMGLWHSAAGLRQASDAPSSSSDAAWCGCVAEARAVKGRRSEDDDDAMIDAEVEADLADVTVEGRAPTSSGPGESRWTTELLNLNDPVVARLVRRHGAPCGVGVNGGSAFLRFQRTVLVSLAEGAGDSGARGQPGRQEDDLSEFCELTASEEAGWEPDEGDNPEAGAKPDEGGPPLLDMVYRCWASAPAAKSIRSYHDPGLSRDKEALIRGAPGMYHLCAVPVGWRHGARRILAYDLGSLLLAAGLDAATEFFTREVGPARPGMHDLPLAPGPCRTPTPHPPHHPRPGVRVKCPCVVDCARVCVPVCPGVLPCSDHQGETAEEKAPKPRGSCPEGPRRSAEGHARLARTAVAYHRLC